MYLEIDEGFPGHRKTLRLCSLLKNPEAGWYMIRLWTWACRSCPTGNLAGLTAYEIETAAQYRPLDGECYAAMVAAGFIDTDEQGPIALHGWSERTGYAIKRMEKNAAYMRKSRGKSKSNREPNVSLTCGPRDVHVTTSPVQSSPVQTSREEKKRSPRASHAEPSPGFADFWKIYPRRVAKGNAIKAWPGDEFLPAIKAALEWQARDLWRDPKFIPHPATWLNACRWEDERPRQAPLVQREWRPAAPLKIAPTLPAEARGWPTSEKAQQNLNDLMANLAERAST